MFITLRCSGQLHSSDLWVHFPSSTPSSAKDMGKQITLSYAVGKAGGASLYVVLPHIQKINKEASTRQCAICQDPTWYLHSWRPGFLCVFIASSLHPPSFLTMNQWMLLIPVPSPPISISKVTTASLALAQILEASFVRKWATVVPTRSYNAFFNKPRQPPITSPSCWTERTTQVDHWRDSSPSMKSILRSLILPACQSWMWTRLIGYWKLVSG